MRERETEIETYKQRQRERHTNRDRERDRERWGLEENEALFIDRNYFRRRFCDALNQISNDKRKNSDSFIECFIQ